MNNQQRALLLVGSPRKSRSTSESLGAYLLYQFQKKGLPTETIHIYQTLKTDESQDNLLTAVDSYDIVILACPLYADSPPALVIRALELITKHRKTKKQGTKQQLLAISNCGFPEAQHNDISLAIYRRFATESGFEWVGGLALGMGEAISGRPLVKMGSLVKNARRSLELTADALAASQPIPQDAVTLMAKPFMPRWL